MIISNGVDKAGPPNLRTFPRTSSSGELGDTCVDIANEKGMWYGKVRNTEKYVRIFLQAPHNGLPLWALSDSQEKESCFYIQCIGIVGVFPLGSSTYPHRNSRLSRITKPASSSDVNN